MMLAQSGLVAEGLRAHVFERDSVKAKPWIVSLFGGAGLTALLAGAFALWASPAQLEKAAALGDARIIEILIAGYVVSVGLCRLFLVRRPLPEERVDEARPQPRHLR
jgi:hypothetical protein